jgi:hypothetical protein
MHYALGVRFLYFLTLACGSIHRQFTSGSNASSWRGNAGGGQTGGPAGQTGPWVGGDLEVGIGMYYGLWWRPPLLPAPAHPTSSSFPLGVPLFSDASRSSTNSPCELLESVQDFRVSSGSHQQSVPNFPASPRRHQQPVLNFRVSPMPMPQIGVRQ